MKASRRFTAFMPSAAALATLLVIALAPPARGQYTERENHSGFWVEWLQESDSTITDVAVGDVNDDGAPDLFVLDGSSLRLWRNDERGKFQPQPEPICPLPLGAFLVFDADHDSRLDLIGAVTGASGGIAFLKGLGNGHFAAPAVSATSMRYQHLIELANGGGVSGLAATADDPHGGIHVLAWRSDAFETIASVFPGVLMSSLFAADLNGDGRTDLVAHSNWNSFSNLLLLLNEGSSWGTKVIPFDAYSVRVVSLDYDGDGDTDLLVSRMGDGHAVLIRGDGSGENWVSANLEEEFGSREHAVQVADLDSNGDPEMLVAWRAHYDSFLLGVFQPRVNPGLSTARLISYMHGYGYGANSDRILIADLNRDRRPDAVIVHNQNWQQGLGTIGVLLNHDGVLGGIHMAALDTPARRAASVRLDRSKPPELVLAGPAGLFLARPLSNGTVEPTRRIGDGMTVRVADLNRDDRDDLIVGLPGDITEVRLTRPDGEHPVSARFEGTVVDFGDLDRDRWPDLLVRTPGGSLDVLWGDPQVRFRRASSTGIGPAITVIADADGDGRNDLVECRFTPYYFYGSYDPIVPDTIRTYRMLHGRRWQLAMTSVMEKTVELRVASARAADLDGRPGDEIVLMDGADGFNSSALRVLRSIGDGAYAQGTRVALGGESPAGLSLADLDGDGDIDAAAVANREACDALLHVRWNDGHGDLSEIWSRRIAGSVTRDLVLDDFDGDGATDVAVLALETQDYETSLLAMMFGRRDVVSAPVSHLDFADAPARDKTNALAIRDLAPNPARGTFTVRWSVPVTSPANIDLLDVAGRRVRAVDSRGARDGEARFDGLEHLPAGLYWVRLRQGNQTVTKRVALIR